MTRMKELEDKNRRFKKMYAEEKLKAESFDLLPPSGGYRITKRLQW